MDGSGKVKSSHHRETVETDFLAVALVDLESHYAGADPVCRISHRLAWTAKVATAAFDIPSFDAPITSSHKILPFAAAIKRSKTNAPSVVSFGTPVGNALNPFDHR